MQLRMLESTGYKYERDELTKRVTTVLEEVPNSELD